jgi:carbamoyl-phosphate synthase large subunit
MTSGLIRVLMTGAGAPGAPGILKCLAQAGDLHVLACDANAYAVGRYLCPSFVTVPKADSADFIPRLRQLCQQNQIQVILPLVTRELQPLAEAKRALEQIGVCTLVSDPGALAIANDKGRLCECLSPAGLPVPEFALVETVEQFEPALRALGYPGRPLCFKPCISNGSRGFRILNDSIDESALLFQEKPSSTYASVESVMRVLRSKPFPRLLVSEYLPGPEYSVDCLADHGRTVLAVPRIRTKMIAGISVEGQVIESKEIIAYCHRVIEIIGLHGNIGVQLKQAADGTFKILEINPRVQGTISAVLGAGVNLPALGVYQAVGRTISPDMLRVKWGTRFTRYWCEVSH